MCCTHFHISFKILYFFRANSDLGYGEGPGSPLIATAVAFSFPSSELYNLKDRRKLDVIDARPFNAVQRFVFKKYNSLK